MTEQETLQKASELVDEALVVLMAYKGHSPAADRAFEDLEDGAAELSTGLERYNKAVVS